MWKTIPNYTMYEVSDSGLVRSWLSKGVHKLESPKVLKASSFCDSNYQRVSLRSDITGKHETRRVHQLVLETFGFNRPTNKHIVMHLNDDPTDNRLSNLKWATSLENMEDMHKKSRHSHSDKHPKSQIKESLRKQIYEMSLIDTSIGSRQRIAAQLNVPVITVYRTLDLLKRRKKSYVT